MKPAIYTTKFWASGGMVDTPVLGTGRAIGEGSSPFRPTIVDTIDTMSDTISYGLIRSRKKGVLVVQGFRRYVSLRNQYGNM